MYGIGFYKNLINKNFREKQEKQKENRKDDDIAKFTESGETQIQISEGPADQVLFYTYCYLMDNGYIVVSYMK